MAGLGGGFDDEHGALNPSARTGSATGGLTWDFFVSSASSPFMSGAGSSSYPNPQLGFDHLALNDEEAWTGADFEQYADQLRGEQEVMPPPVRVALGGSNRRMNFRAPRHASGSGGSGDEGFVAPVARPPCASGIGSTGRTVRAPRLRRLGAVNEEDHINASGGKVLSWLYIRLLSSCVCFVYCYEVIPIGAV